MVCPNCQSDEIIAVQDQHYCINCGQLVPPEAVRAAKPEAVGAAVATAARHGAFASQAPAPSPTPINVPTPAKAPEPAPIVPAKAPEPAPIISRARLADKPSKLTKSGKKRKVGRPKAGRLDVPHPVAAEPAPSAVPDITHPTPPKIRQPMHQPAQIAPLGPRSMSDIAPRQPRPVVDAAPSQPTAKPEATPSKHRQKRKSAHKVGVPPLHFGSMVTFTLRARVRPRLLGLSAMASLAFAAVAGYGVWLLLSGGLPNLAEHLTSSAKPVLGEAIILAALYYVGRSIGQAAIIYGVAREADHRPVPLSQQFGVGINTFGRRLLLDLGFGLSDLALLALGGIVVVVGGQSLPVNPQIQIAATFLAFLFILYLLSAQAITRGLAGVALTLSSTGPFRASALGWRLFSHRFELLGLRFLAVGLELLLAVPLAVLALAFIAAAPANLHVVVAVAVGLLAWFAGAFFGAGTATWWAALYRQLILADRPDTAVGLLSGSQGGEAHRLPLALVVSLTTFLVVAGLVLPWLNFL